MVLWSSDIDGMHQAKIIADEEVHSKKGWIGIWLTTKRKKKERVRISLEKEIVPIKKESVQIELKGN